MAKQARRGRPRKSYTTSWGEAVEGLARDTDGRWRVMATGKRFSEGDERRTVARFRTMVEPDTLDSPSRTRFELPQETGKDQVFIRSEKPADDFWPWLREQMIERPEYVTQMTGIPELANLRHPPLPKPAVKIKDLIATYERDNPSTERAKQ